MKIEDLENAIGSNETSYSKIGSTAITNIMQYVDVTLEMDRSSFDYYYKIDVNNLLKSDMPINDLEDLKKEGWAFSEDKKSLIIFLTV